MQPTGISDFYSVWQGRRIYVCPFCGSPIKYSFGSGEKISFDPEHRNSIASKEIWNSLSKESGVGLKIASVVFG